eukprot:8224946-Lingulodinium_polyedra.AAC.1
MDMQAHSCACPPGATHGIAWGNRSSYGQESGVGSLKLQHAAQFLWDVMADLELTRPPWRGEVPPVPDSN